MVDKGLLDGMNCDVSIKEALGKVIDEINDSAPKELKAYSLQFSDYSFIIFTDKILEETGYSDGDIVEENLIDALSNLKLNGFPFPAVSQDTSRIPLGGRVSRLIDGGIQKIFIILQLLSTDMDEIEYSANIIIEGENRGLLSSPEEDLYVRPL